MQTLPRGQLGSMYAANFRKGPSSDGDFSSATSVTALEVLPAEWICSEVARLRVANDMLSERLDLVESGAHIAGYQALKGLVAKLQCQVRDMQENGWSGANGDKPETKESLQSITQGISGSAPLQNEKEDGDAITWAQLQAMDAEHEKYTLNPTTWEIPIFVGCHPLKTGVSAMILFGLVLTLATQFVMISAILTFGVEFQESTVDELARWRVTEGHSLAFAHPVTKASLTSRVCAGDDSLSVGTSQEDLYESLSKFSFKAFGLVPVGSCLALVVLFVWSLYIVVEINAIRELLITIRSIKRGVSHIRMDGPDSCQLTLISIGRVTWVSFICLIRLGVAMCLFVLGTQWQIKTRDMENLVLNASALAFVIADVPALIYDVVVPMKAKVLLETLEPLKRAPRKRYAGFEVLMLLDMASVGIFVICCFYYLYYYQDLQTQAMDALCHGEKDFLWAKDNLNRVLTSAAPDADTMPADLYPHEVEYLQSIVDYQNPVGVFDPHQLQTVSTREVADYTFTNLDECIDVVALEGMWILGEPSSRRISCSEAADYCLTSSLVRYRCPVTCGCDDPWSGMPFMGSQFGCPRRACIQSVKWKAYLEHGACENMQPAELARNRSWLQVFDNLKTVIQQELRDAAPLLQSDSRTDMIDLLEDIPSWARSDGCSTINKPELEPFLLFMLQRNFAHICLTAAPFCPRSCRCHITMTDGCPNSCANFPNRRLQT